MLRDSRRSCRSGSAPDLAHFRSDPGQYQSLVTLLAHIITQAGSELTDGGEENGETNGPNGGNGNGSIDRTRQGVSGFNGRGNIGDGRGGRGLTKNFDRRQAGDRRLAADAMTTLREIDRAGFFNRFPEARHIQTGDYSGHIDSRFRR